MSILSDDQIILIRDSFGKVAPEADAAAAAFYARLFEIAPEVRELFPIDLDEQGRKLMATLGAVVRNLHDLEGLTPTVEALARRHVGYGVVPEHYPLVGQALIETLDTALGDDFGQPAAEAWGTAYGALSSVMVSAAYPAAS